MRLVAQPKYMLLIGAWIITTSLLGGLATEIGPWYYSLKQPAWKPPDWAFGVVWTTIFALSGLAWLIAIRYSTSQAQKNKLTLLFVFNSFLNVLWSVFFFRMHRLDWSFIEAFFLWGSVFSIIYVMWPIRKSAAYLMAPYLIWVTIAMRLNWETLVLNPGAY